MTEKQTLRINYVGWFVLVLARHIDGIDLSLRGKVGGAATSKDYDMEVIKTFPLNEEREANIIFNLITKLTFDNYKALPSCVKNALYGVTGTTRSLITVCQHINDNVVI